MVDPDRPVLRAFFEGDNDHEARVLLADDGAPATGSPASWGAAA
jgi:hypothetical protein